MGAMLEIAKDLPVYFPVHPRTQVRMVSAGLINEDDGSLVHLLPPLSYGPFWPSTKMVNSF